MKLTQRGRKSLFRIAAAIALLVSIVTTLYILQRSIQYFKFSSLRNNDHAVIYYSLNTQVGYRKIVIDENNQAYYLSSSVHEKGVLKAGRLSTEQRKVIDDALSANGYYTLSEKYEKNSPLTETPYRTFVVEDENVRKTVRVERHTVPEPIENIEQIIIEQLEKLPDVHSESETDEMCQVFTDHFFKYKEEYQSGEEYYTGCLRLVKEIVEES